VKKNKEHSTFKILLSKSWVESKELYLKKVCRWNWICWTNFFS